MEWTHKFHAVCYVRFETVIVKIMSENKSGFSFGFRILVSGFGCLLQVSVTRLIWNAS